MDERRYSRNEALFGAEGQKKIAHTKTAIIGLGGLGSHLAQQLAYLGVLDYRLIDHDIVTASSLNRLIGAVSTDVLACTTKVAVADRTIHAVLPDAAVQPLQARVEADDVPALIATADVVFGCLDRDSARLKLTELCARFAKRYFDLASDTDNDNGQATYGGRVVFCDGTQCLFCLGLLDQEEMARGAMAPEHREAHDRIYGVPRRGLAGTGPSVVSVNGVVASLAVTEFMLYVTGLGEPTPHIKYFGEKRLIRRSTDPPAENCPYCTGIWGAGVPTA